MEKLFSKNTKIIYIFVVVVLLFPMLQLLSNHNVAWRNSRSAEAAFHVSHDISNTVQHIYRLNSYYNIDGHGIISIYYEEGFFLAYKEELDCYYISWNYSFYVEPNFQAQRISFNEPQYIRVAEYFFDTDGWALASTNFGEFWIYLNSSSRLIERRKGLFCEIGDIYPVSYINPQTVVVLKSYNDWLLIETCYTPKWLYLNFLPNDYAFDALLRPFGNTLSVYFYNIEAGFNYTYNTNRRYFSASVTKASFALYIYQKAERGEVDLDSYVTFTHADFLGGSGIIWRNYLVGTQFTQRELLRKNLMYSDNVATLMLRRVHGINGYRQFITSLGANPSYVRENVFDSSITIQDAGIFMRAINDYIESGGIYSDEFRQHLLNNQYPFMISDYPVASKTGWTYPYAWHEMAIVYAPSPYILVILSRGRSGTEGDYQVFADIAQTFQHFNSKWFTTYRSIEDT